MSLQQRVWEILEAARPDDRVSRSINVMLLALILVNVLAVIVETVDSIHQQFGAALRWIEIISVGVFTVEYLARAWACTADPQYRHPVLGRLRFLAKPMSIIDLLAILPAYLVLIPVDLRFLRALRLFRIFRIAKLGRYSTSVRLIGSVLSKKREELIVTGMVMGLLVVLASSFMYFAEHEAQPDKFPDIPTSMWWAVVTLTTVGYGDVYPVTTLGRVFAGVIAVLGIGMFALPAGILGASFMEELDRHKGRGKVCPHCGKELP